VTGPIDISMPLVDGIAVWPGSPGLDRRSFKAMGEGDPVNATELRMDVHVGTHFDAPLHTLADGGDVGSVPLERLNGPVHVADVPGVRRIGAEALDAAAVPAGTTRLLLRTLNSAEPELWQGPFDEDYAALTVEGASWIVDHGIELVGIDYLSIQRYEDPIDTHLVLLSAAVVILEGLVLRDVAPGAYRLACLPLALPEAEAAPARAILYPEGQ
jgi:arylformamidase